MKLEKSYNTKQYFHSFYRQNHALLVLSFLFTVICFPANLIGSWLLGQVIDAITEVSMNRLRTIILVSIIETYHGLTTSKPLQLRCFQSG